MSFIRWLERWPIWLLRLTFIASGLLTALLIGLVALGAVYSDPDNAITVTNLSDEGIVTILDSQRSNDVLSGDAPTIRTVKRGGHKLTIVPGTPDQLIIDFEFTVGDVPSELDLEFGGEPVVPPSD